jgi:hypothetical protein
MRPRRLVQVRRTREWLALCAATALIPRTTYHWQLTWVGLDVLLLAFTVATAVLVIGNRGVCADAGRKRWR